jgi:inhibitor of KinA
MRTFSLGENALTIEFGNEISADLNRRALRLSEMIAASPFDGFVETVPAYASMTVIYDSQAVYRSFPHAATAYDAVRAIVETAAGNIDEGPSSNGREVEIAVSFDNRDAMDLTEIAGSTGFSADEFVEIFLSRTYRVYMIGFLPGFAYMGEVDERIAVPRRATPRLHVPAGSVGIAGTQTGVYPLVSPGGWNIIGRTDQAMFTPDGPEPCFLKTGDSVFFKRK